ncbi:hypothetical protein Vi05172_g5998 [Venturia inaequalis]|nr:hypothetical protein Vi05172_g5998 [Venturia inaequalis]
MRVKVTKALLCANIDQKNNRQQPVQRCKQQAASSKQQAGD